MRRYTVLGEVPSPGVFDMPSEGEVRVLDAMQKAGLLTISGQAGEALGTALRDRLPTADLEHAQLRRAEVVVPLNLAALLAGDTSQDLLLQSGDVLTVPRRQVMTVSVMGEVHAPGKQVVPVTRTCSTC
jgi:protein involved in polysaccharide export with SLBB domain